VRAAAFHPWDVDEDEAKEIQVRLSRLVVLCDDDFPGVGLVAGVSVRPVDTTTVRAAIYSLNVPSMETVDSATAAAKSHFRYMSGLRAFQAGPAIIAAFEKLRTRPDVVLWDGHGISHPRRCGLAAHLGVLLNVPSVGVSEELLYGNCTLDALAKERGSRLPVVDPKDNIEIGAAVRTRSHIRPVFVSVGHRISLESAIRIVLECTPRYRIPEPLRAARIHVRGTPSSARSSRS
jgi:deoxyribonuclease V